MFWRSPFSPRRTDTSPKEFLLRFGVMEDFFPSRDAISIPYILLTARCCSPEFETPPQSGLRAWRRCYVSLVFRTCCVLGSHFWLSSVRVVSSASRDKTDNGCRLSSYKAACVRRSREVNVANTSLKEPSRKEFCHIWAASSHRFQVSAGMRAIGTSARDARQLPPLFLRYCPCLNGDKH